MRIGRTSTICLLSVCGVYAAGFVGCGGDTTSSGRTGGTGANTGSGTSTTIVISGAGGAGGAGGSGSGGTTTGGGGSGGDVIINDDAACVAEPRAGEQIPLDLFFMVDKSGSMNCPVGQPGMNCTSPPNPTPAVTRWTSIKDALNQFAVSADSSGLGAGMGFFPSYSGGGTNGNLLCMPTDYSTPAAPIAILPGAAGALQTAINMQMPGGSTPTVPALSGAITYATSYAQSHPGRTVGIVFATDGAPTECLNNNNTVPGAARVAMAAATGTPPIKTYVLGVGPNLTSLNDIASAGGSGMAHLVEGGGATELLDALNAIRKGALTCDYKIPTLTGSGKAIDYKAVNVRTRVGPPPASEMLLTHVMDATGCGSTGGWYYTPNDTAPTSITICPASCDPLLKTTGSSMTVLMGCKTVGIPPK